MPGECCFEDDGDVDGGVVDEDNVLIEMMMIFMIMCSGVS